MAPAKFECTFCGKSFTRRSALHRHNRTVHGGESVKCEFCGQKFSRKDNYLRHVKSHHVSRHDGEDNRNTQQGGGKPDGADKSEPQVNEPIDDEQTCFSEEEAINGNLNKISMKAEDQTKYDPLTFLKSKEEAIRSLLKKALLKRRGMKVYITMQVRFSKQRGDQVETTDPFFHGRCHIILKMEDIDMAIKESMKKIMTSFVEYQREGSNWSLDKVLEININIANYRPIKGSSFIPLPAKLVAKKAIVNVQNTDNKCFMWSILAALHSIEGHHANPNRVSNYVNYIDELEFTGITFPVKIDEIPKFEKRNDISVNVFGYEKGDIYPLHLTKERGLRHVNLLLISNGKKQHYCWIKNFNRLLSDQNNHKSQYHYCHYCLHGFTKKALLKKHIPYCKVHGAQRTEMPSEDDRWLKFNDVSKQLKVPFVVYADFECILEKIYGCQPNPSKSSTIKLAKHKPSGFTYKVVGLNEDLTEDHVTYRGPDAADVFIDHMVELEERLIHVLRNSKPMELTDNEFESFQKATHCSICGGELGHNVARDHCHITGKFRGAAHMSCNLNYKLRERIPVFFHNLRGYDAHLIMEAIGKVKNRRLNCIPQNHEKYISFSLGRMEFIDTFQFLSTSLQKLVENLSEEDVSKFSHLHSYVQNSHPGNAKIKMELLSRKGVYPYRYMNSFCRFSETNLPSKEAFYNDLTESNISEEDYFHAQLVWDVLNIKNLGEYHDLYMETDVHLLADVFENFRTLCLNKYDLDPAHFYTSPGLAWQAALKMTGVELELFTDPDMHLFIEKGLRGGVAMITKRYAKANIPGLKEYDADKDISSLIYLDANNLYGWGMSQPLPTNDFDWLNKEDIKAFDVSSISSTGDIGYILEVDLEYPEHLHDHHNDYPLAPESLEIKQEMLSAYQVKLLKKLKMKATRCSKLVPNLHDKQNYVIHYQNLQLYLSLGMKLKKIHRVLRFQQSPWLKPYIDFNTDMRKVAKNEFEKDFYKLMNNSVFGKTMENLRKRVDIQLVNQEKRLLKLTKKPGFKSFKIFNEDLASIELQKSKLVLNRPIYVGFSILDLSKVLMYDFHYNYIKRKYGNTAQLLFTDTDSLCYDIKTEDIQEDMAKDKHLFDFSGYKKDHPLYDTTNKKVIGKMKDELNGAFLKEFVGLRAKMYSILYEREHTDEEIEKLKEMQKSQDAKEIVLEEKKRTQVDEEIEELNESGKSLDEKEKVIEEKKRAKGVLKAVIESKLRHDLYTRCLFKKESQMESMNLFRTDKHQIHTVKINKTTLSAFDDKRYLLGDGIHTLAYGHWRTLTLS
ncbi:hypothetical protein FSP39_016008 [Pinctada imbricata]|uniref:C2H2-type domain-containing protein n=1 Tax=Pinctada imbricata TaxID=66713 RepID=A0AA88YPK5_PINIB|nr:hypothetical protein FSP39_016008 [Pinctada imbricata]